MSLLLEKETVDYILNQDYDWKPNPVIPEIFPVMGQADRVSEYSIIKDNKLHNKIMSFFENANTFYNFNLDGKCSIKIQKYKNSGHIDWHMDEEIKEGVGSQKTTNVRMLSMSILLNEDFKGGQMLIQTENKEFPIQKYNGPIGEPTIFPSTWLHKVEPITEGVRYVLTAWAYGDI